MMQRLGKTRVLEDAPGAEPVLQDTDNTVGRPVTGSPPGGTSRRRQ